MASFQALFQEGDVMSKQEMNFKFYAVLFILMAFVTLSLGLHSQTQMPQTHAIEFVSLAD